MSASPSHPQKSVLGKGLASLFPPVGAGLPPLGSVAANETVVASTNSVVTPNRDRHPGIAVLPIDEIGVNEFQPRRDFDQKAIEELAQSIRENGLIQPLIVRKNGEKYELIAGERRLRASKLAGLKMIPVVIRKSTNREALELAVVENIQREDLNCVDEALAYFQLIQEFNLSQEELATRMGKERATVANALRVLKLSDFILGELKKDNLTRGHAKALLSVEDVVERERLAREILQKNLSVRQTEKLAQEKKLSVVAKKESDGSAATEKAAPSPQILQLGQTLTRRYMTKVAFKGTQKNGQIVFHYSSPEELNRLFSSLMGEQEK